MCLLGLAPGKSAFAQTWDGTNYPTSNWSVSSNWTGGLPTNNGTANVIFSSGNVAANLDANWNISTLTFSGGSYPGTPFLSGTNTLTLQSGLTSSFAQSGFPEVSLAANINVATSQTWNITTSDLPVTGTISGAGSITKSGNGSLTLSAGNTYSGGTSLLAGTIFPTDDTSFGNLSGQLQINGGTIGYKTVSYTDTSTLTVARSLLVGSSGGTITAKRNLTLASSISGTGSLTIARDASTPYIGLTPEVILSGNNTFNGGLSITDPLFAIFSSDTWTVAVTGTYQSLGNGPVSVGAGTTLSVNSVSNIGDGYKIKLAAQTALIVTTDAFTPAQIVDPTSTQASLELGTSTYGQALNMSAIGDGSFTLGAAAGETATYTASSLSPGAGNVYRFGGSGTLVISGNDNVLTGSASVVATGAVNLLNANNFTGGISGGSIGVGNDGALGTGTVTSYNLISLNGMRTIRNPLSLVPGNISYITGPFTLTGPVNLGGGTPHLFVSNPNGASVIFNDVIQNGTLNVNSGTATLQGVNTFAALQLLGGSASVASENNLGGTTTPISLSGSPYSPGQGGNLETTTSFTLSNPISSSNGALQVDPGTTLTLSNAITIANNASLYKTGAGNLAFSSNSTLSGATTTHGWEFLINGGNVLSSGNSLSTAYVGADTGGTFSGTGSVYWLALEGGQIAPGGGVGTIAATDLSMYGPGLLQFQFSQQGSPNYSNLVNSGNGLVSFSVVTSGSSFSGNVASIYLPAGSIPVGTIYKGAFFDQTTSPVAANFLAGLGFNFFVPSPSGTVTFNGTTYAYANFAVQQTWVAENGGQVCQFTVEPSLGAPPGTIPLNSPYTYSFPNSGSATFALTSGTLPPGVTLSSTGVLTGTPTQAGSYSLGITSTNASGVGTSENFTLSVQASQVSTDTPTMPAWGLLGLATALLAIAVSVHPSRQENKGG
jgi:autotransporter-associated beta strand protein